MCSNVNTMHDTSSCSASLTNKGTYDQPVDGARTRTWEERGSVCSSTGTERVTRAVWLSSG